MPPPMPMASALGRAALLLCVARATAEWVNPANPRNPAPVAHATSRSATVLRGLGTVGNCNDNSLPELYKTAVLFRWLLDCGWAHFRRTSCNGGWSYELGT